MSFVVNDRHLSERTNVIELKKSNQKKQPLTDHECSSGFFTRCLLLADALERANGANISRKLEQRVKYSGPIVAADLSGPTAALSLHFA